jgi:hypothetical protein
MKLTFEVLFPALRPWVVNLVDVWPAYVVKPQFAAWEVAHVLSLILLGGTAVLMNLRLLGAGLTAEPPSDIYRNLRRWQDAGVIGILVSGVLIGMVNAERLYDSAAFVVKMLALAAGVVLTYGASRPVARADGAVSTSVRLWFALGAILWLIGVGLFAAATLVDVGLFHVLTAAALLALAAARGRWRWICLAGLGLLIAVHQAITHGMVQADDLARLDPVNKTFFALYSLWIVGTGLLPLVLAGRGRPDGVLGRLIACATILAWITAAAAGRWIAFA